MHTHAPTFSQARTVNAIYYNPAHLSNPNILILGAKLVRIFRDFLKEGCKCLLHCSFLCFSHQQMKKPAIHSVPQSCFFFLV